MFAVQEHPRNQAELADLPDARIEERFEQVHAEIERLQTERLELLAQLEHRRIFQHDGHLSITAWCVARFCMGWGAAKELVMSARALEEMPETSRALQTSEISSSALQAARSGPGGGSSSVLAF
jgi:hypothetical protein